MGGDRPRRGTGICFATPGPNPQGASAENMTPKGTQRASCSALVTPQAGGALPATALWPPRRPRPGLAWPGLRGTAGPTDTGTGAAPAPGQGKTGEERGEGRGGKRRPLRCHSRSAGGRPRAGAAAP